MFRASAGVGSELPEQDDEDNLHPFHMKFPLPALVLGTYEQC